MKSRYQVPKATAARRLGRKREDKEKVWEGGVEQAFPRMRTGSRPAPQRVWPAAHSPRRASRGPIDWAPRASALRARAASRPGGRLRTSVLGA